MFYSSVRTRPIGAPGNELTFHAIVEVYTSGPYLRTLLGTLLLALLCAVIATAGGGLFAWILTRTDIRFRGFFEMVILAPLFLSPFIGAVAWVALAAPKSGMLNVNLGHLFGREGDFTLINVMSVPGLIWVLSLYYIPYGYLFVSAALRNMDAALEEASYVNGHSTWRTARRVTFPLVRPAMVASFFFIAVLATGVFTVPTVLATSTGFVPLAVRMYRAVGVYPTDYAVGGAIGTLLFFLTVLGVYLYRRAVGNSKRFVTVGGRGYRPRRIRLGPWRPVWAALLFGYFLAAVALPYAALVIISLTPYAQTDLTNMSLSFANFTKVAGSAKVVDATINTLLLGVAAPTACVVLGLMIAFIVHRSRSRLRGAVDYLSTVTVAIPGIVLGLGMLWVYVRTPLYATPWILLLAYVALYVPHAARLAGSGLMQIDPSLEEASTINGARLWRTLGRVTFPLTKPALLSAWILIFIFSGREVNAAIILYTPGSAVLPVLTFDYADSGLVQNAAVVGILQTCMLHAGVLIARVLFRVKLSSSM
jgi:iron(III) transport system permease protein